MTGKTVDWLVREVNDLLDVSSVGLYEFLNLLNDPDDPIPVEDRLTVARQALERILSDEGVHLFWMKWPEFDHRDVLSISDLPEDPFSGPDQHGSYIAVDRP